MKDDTLYVLDGDDKRELDELRRKVRSLVITREGPTRPVRPVEDTSAWHTWVRLFSSTKVGGFYPGTLGFFDTVTKSFGDLGPEDTVWIREATSKPLQQGIYYWCRLEGDLTTTVDTRALYLVSLPNQTINAARMSLIAPDIPTAQETVPASSVQPVDFVDNGALVVFNLLEYDTDGYFVDPSGTLFTIPSGLQGLYHVDASVQFRTTSNVPAVVQAFLDWTNDFSQGVPDAIGYATPSFITVDLESVDAGDTVGLTVSADIIMHHTNTVGLNVGALDALTGLAHITAATLSLRRVGPAPPILNTPIGGSSGSGSGSGGGGVITSMGKGSATSGAAAVASLTLSSVSIAAGTLLVVNVGIGDSAFAPTATFDGTPMNLAAAEALGGVALAGRTAVFYLEVTTATTGNIVATMGIGTASMMLSAVEVTGLASFTVDSAGFASGNVISPSVSITTTTAATYIQSAIMIGTRVGAADFGTGYGGDFASGGQDVTTTGTNGYGLAEGFKITSATGTYSATLGDSPTAWAAVLVAFK